MGYAPTTPYSLFEFACSVEPTVTATTVAAQVNINNITIPSFRGSPDYAYLDVYTFGRCNTNIANPNYLLNNSTIGIVDTGATYRSGGSFGAGSLRAPTGTTIWCPEHLFGTVNLAPYINSGDTITVAMYLDSIQNNIDIYSVSGKLRLYFSIV